MPAHWGSDLATTTREDGPLLLDSGVTINDAPIHVWLYRDHGKIVDLREVGHATEEVCAAVSKDLFYAQIDTHVTGFLQYGVADLRPRDDAGRQKLADTFADIQTLSSQHPTWVIVTEVDGAPDVVFSRTPKVAAGRSEVTLTGVIGADRGPEFVPVRIWKPGSTPQPLEIVVTRVQLGLTPQQLDRLGGAVNVGAWSDAIAKAATELRRFEDLQAWIQDGAKIDNAVGTVIIKRASNPTIESLNDSIAVAKRVIAAAHVVEPLVHVLASSSIKVDTRTPLAGAQNALEANQWCLDHLNDCDEYVEVTLAPIKPELQQRLADLRQEALAVPTDTLERVITDARAVLTDERAKLAAIAQKPTARTGRECLVDALLRGWPPSVDTDEDRSLVLATIETRIPAIWHRELDLLQRRGIVIEDDGAGGDLVGQSVFYRVREDAAGSFHITPTYIVHGTFGERWSASHHTISMVQPHD